MRGTDLNNGRACACFRLWRSCVPCSAVCPRIVLYTVVLRSWRQVQYRLYNSQAQLIRMSSHCEHGLYGLWSLSHSSCLCHARVAHPLPRYATPYTAEVPVPVLSCPAHDTRKSTYPLVVPATLSLLDTSKHSLLLSASPPCHAAAHFLTFRAHAWCAAARTSQAGRGTCQAMDMPCAEVRNEPEALRA